MQVPRNQRYRRLLGAATISQVGDWSARLALAALLLEATGSAVWVGAVSAAFVLPWIGLGQLLTAWTERFSRARVMISGDTLRGLIFILLAMIDMPPGLTLVAIVVAASVDPVFEANATSAVIESLSDEDQDTGIQTKQVVSLLAQVAGIGAAGVALRWFSPQQILAVNAVSFFVSASIIASVASRLGQNSAPADRGEVLEGLRLAAAQPDIRAAVGTTMITGFSATTIEAQVVVLASGRPSWTLPLASALIPLGAAVAAGLAPTKGSTSSLIRRSLGLSTAAAITAAILLEIDTALGIVVIGALVGIMFQTTTTGQVVAFRHLPTLGRASVINMLQTLVFLAIAAGGLASGLAIRASNLQTGLQVCVLITLLAWLVPMPPYLPKHGMEGVLEDSGATYARHVKWSGPDR